MTRKAEPQDPLAEVRALLERLNLTTAARCLQDLLAQAEGTHPAYSEFLRQLLEVEQSSRWERKLQRRRRWSKLGPPLALEGFDWAARPQLSPQVVKELLTCRFIDEHRNVILVGRPSTGKTTVAKALGHAACSHALSVYYAPTADVLGNPARRPRRWHLPQGLPPRQRRRPLDPRRRGLLRPRPRRRQRALSRRLCQVSAALHAGGFQPTV